MTDEQKKELSSLWGELEDQFLEDYEEQCIDDEDNPEQSKDYHKCVDRLKRLVWEVTK